ncbi:MAG TPA: universal stress protein [Hyphomicrobiales bacterium]|nr:universal stress protein [Hyphomicrobiales bacterium]
MKAVLVPTEQSDVLPSILETARLVAERFGSYVEGLPLRFDLAAMLPLDAVGGAMFPSPEWNDDDVTQHAREAFEGFMAGRGIPRAGAVPANGPTFAWLEDVPRGESFVAGHARVFDLTVVGRPGGRGTNPRMSTLEMILFESGRPILMAPPAPPKTLGEVVTIAWNRSSETARAVAMAMPLLKRAREVLVLGLKNTTVPGPGPEELARTLQLHGIAATSRMWPGELANAGEAFLAGAAEAGSDLLIKGAFTQSRLRQMIFGGPTAYVLAEATIPVLLAH